jgi:hypothetical protein
MTVVLDDDCGQRISDEEESQPSPGFPRTKIRHGNAGKLDTYDIIPVLPDKFARVLF